MVAVWQWMRCVLFYGRHRWVDSPTGRYTRCTRCGAHDL